MRFLGRRSIHDRTAVVNVKERCGDWEVDTINGKQGTGDIVKVLELKRRFYLASKIATNLACDTGV